MFKYLVVDDVTCGSLDLQEKTCMSHHIAYHLYTSSLLFLDADFVSPSESSGSAAHFVTEAVQEIPGWISYWEIVVFLRRNIHK